jgi:hypothetical protein
MKDFVKIWVWQFLDDNREQFGFTVIPNRGYTADDQATLISIVVNYLFAERQADESTDKPKALRDYVTAHRAMVSDAADVIFRESNVIYAAVINTLLRQYDIRTKKLGKKYENTEEGQKVVSLLKTYAPEKSPDVTEEYFRSLVNGLARMKVNQEHLGETQ